MVCTEGFCTDVDAPDVRTVTISGRSRSTLEAWKAVGRFERDGTAGKLKMLSKRAHIMRDGVKNKAGRDLLEEFRQWMENKTGRLPMRDETYLESGNDPRECSERGQGCEYCSGCTNRPRIEINYPADAREETHNREIKTPEQIREGTYKLAQ